MVVQPTWAVTVGLKNFTESAREPKPYASGARVDHGKSISGTAMRLSVGTLAPGAYSVTWHVLSVD